ncbi:hypothetical protein EC973_007883, partial [Apophysomyces ossiformis]
MALDSSIGSRPPRPTEWKKYWNADIAIAAATRDRCYRRWRRAIGIDKVLWWNRHQEAVTIFRSAVKTAKRASWHAYCHSLEVNFEKATSKIKSLRRRHNAQHSFSHPDGPQAAAE